MKNIKFEFSTGCKETKVVEIFEFEDSVPDVLIEDEFNLWVKKYSEWTKATDEDIDTYGFKGKVEINEF